MKRKKNIKNKIQKIIEAPQKRKETGKKKQYKEKKK